MGCVFAYPCVASRFNLYPVRDTSKGVANSDSTAQASKWVQNLITTLAESFYEMLNQRFRNLNIIALEWWLRALHAV